MAELSSHGEEHSKICTENKPIFFDRTSSYNEKLTICHYFDLTYISCTAAYSYIWHERFEHFTSSFRESDRLIRDTHCKKCTISSSSGILVCWSCSVALHLSWRRQAAQGLGEGCGRSAARPTAARRRARHLHQRRCQRQPHRRTLAAREPATVSVR